MPSRMSSAGSFGICTSELLDAVRSHRVFAIELMYSDREGGQRASGRFALAPLSDAQWLCSVVRHWNLDRPDPR